MMTNIIENRMVSRSWRNYGEEEYLWEDMSPRLENHGRGSDNSRKDYFFPGDPKKWSSLERETPNSDCHMDEPLSHVDRPIT